MQVRRNAVLGGWRQAIILVAVLLGAVAGSWSALEAQVINAAPGPGTPPRADSLESGRRLHGSDLPGGEGLAPGGMGTQEALFPAAEGLPADAGAGSDVSGLDLGLFGAAPQAAKMKIEASFSAPGEGQPARLFIVAAFEPTWYTYSITQPAGGPRATTIIVDPSPQYRLIGPFEASPPPKKKRDPLFDNMVVETHHDHVVWHAPIKLAAGVDPAQVTITGKVKAQLCDPKRCLPPAEFAFTARLGPPVELPKPAAETENGLGWGLLAVLAAAFAGGLVLNLMPCVLPVISLKIFAFFQQAGESRGRILALNLWYVAGLLSVFLLLATLAALLGMAWGEHFTHAWFKIALTAVVFVMALSFLGVWEIPIPGFLGAGKAGELQTREGAAGAFFKGVFTTILATPCSGPLLGSTFGFLLGKPALVIYLVFAAMGLGMGLPYILIGLFPGLVRRLPRPGAWMQTVQQVMAFLLLGTMVFLMSTMSARYFVPTLTLLVGLWFACWWIGRTPLTASPRAKATAWGGSLAAAALTGYFAFGILLAPPLINWTPYSPEALRQARADGKTVMVDFSAAWCLTCKANLKFAIERPAVAQLVKEYDIVPLLADWTDYSPQIKQALNELGCNSIPVLAVWPAGAGDDEVIILRDLLTESQVVEALKRAGPSNSAARKAPANRLMRSQSPPTAVP